MKKKEYNQEGGPGPIQILLAKEMDMFTGQTKRDKRSAWPHRTL